jgi:hypothetical protein
MVVTTPLMTVEEFQRLSTPDGMTVTYRSGQEIPLPFGNAAVAVDAILG